MISAKFLQVQTSADGASFVTLPSQPAISVDIYNGTGTDLTFLHTTDADNTEFVLPSGLAFSFRGITNANQLKVKRTDESATQVTLKSVEAIR